MRINIFYLISGLLSLLLVATVWLIFIPFFYEADVSTYEAVKTLALIMSALLIIGAAIQIYMAVRREDTNLEEET